MTISFPDRLYGRDEALAGLADGYARVRAQGGFAVSLVHGPSGIGKSSLLAAFTADARQREAIVIKVRADQYGGGTPYAALVDGLRRLVARILVGSDAEIADWRGRIAAGLCDLDALVALVPELRLLLDGAPGAAPGIDGGARVAAAVLCLLRAFATPGRPLVVVFDNADWLDAATALLLEQVARMAPNLPVLLVLGARSRSGAAGLAARLAGRAACFHDIALDGLAPPALERLLADAFGRQADVAQLAVLVHHKTAGHPYFVRRFVAALVEDGLALPGGDGWRFDFGRIGARGFTDNMVALALQRLASLPISSQPVLGALAGIGRPGSPALLCEVCGTDAPRLAALLAPAVAADVLAWNGEAYAFTHDRLQEAAYDLLDRQQAARFHLAAGRLLARQAAHDGRDDTLFRAAGHLAQARALIPASDAPMAARLAARAGRRARRSCAYDAAAGYFAHALELLAQAPPAAARESQVFEIECELAHCRFQTGQLDACAELVARLLAAPAGLLARGRVQRLAVDLQVRLGRYREAAAIALDALRALGIDIPAEPDEQTCDDAHARVRTALTDDPARRLLALAPLDDAEVALAFQLLSSLLVAAAFTSPRLLFLQSCESLQLTLRHGITADSTVALGWFGVMVCERYGAFDEGFACGQAARTLVARHRYLSHEAQVLLALDQLSVWTQPLAFSLACAQAGFEAARAQGDFTMACFEACHHTCLLLARGDRLAEVRDAIEHALHFVAQAGFADVEAILRTQRQFVDHLTALPEAGGGRGALLGNAEYGAPDGGEAMSTLRFWRWLYVAVADYLDGDAASALACLEQAERLAWSAPAHIHQLEFHLFSALALCGLPRARADGHERIGRHVAQIAAWAASNPGTFADKLALAQGACREYDGDDPAALDCFERAAAHARAQGFEHIAGIAHERAAMLALRRGWSTAAGAHLDAACQAYRRWGALGKVARLEAAFAQARSPALPGTAAIRDIDSAIRSARALSEEIHAVPLVQALMTIALEHADAERGLLIRREGDGLVVQARARPGGAGVGDVDGVQVEFGQTVPDGRDLPMSMLEAALRTRQPVAVSDSRRPAPHAQDPYLLAHPRCAAIAIPMLKRAQPVGLLYLENRVSSRGFSGEQAQVLSLLAAQAAVSLETAQLYAELLEENRERRRVEKALRESRATLLLGERINQSGSWTWEVERGVVNCSAEFRRLVGLDPDVSQVALDVLMDRVHPGDREAVLRALGDAAAACRPLRFEHRLADGGGMRHLSVVGQPLEEDDPAVYVGTVSDITRRRRDEEALRTAQAELARGARATTVGELTAAIAHEVNQPLMSISANAGAALRWLRREPPRVDLAAALLREIGGQSQRAGKIIQTLQGLGYRSPQFAPVDLHALLRATLALGRADLDRHEVALELDLRAGASAVGGDAAQLQQVLVNLLNNAVEAMAPVEGRRRLLRIASGAGDGRIAVRVEDNGVGVKEDGIETMFEPFVSTKPEGMGMGLAVCRSIIEAHGGSIHAEAGRPHGCIVAFSLPERP